MSNNYSQHHNLKCLKSYTNFYCLISKKKAREHTLLQFGLCVIFISLGI